MSLPQILLGLYAAGIVALNIWIGPLPHRSGFHEREIRDDL